MVITTNGLAQRYPLLTRTRGQAVMVDDRSLLISENAHTCPPSNHLRIGGTGGFLLPSFYWELRLGSDFAITERSSGTMPGWL